ncbi:MAG: cytidine deaminase [Aeromicrobium sp.]|nr:cytidine deaminase [Burkholderiales bacterium]
MNFRQSSSDPSELVIGIIGPIGCNRKLVLDTITTLAKHYAYEAEHVKVSKLIEDNADVAVTADDQYVRVTNLIKAGNELRRRTDDNSVLAKLAAGKISEIRRGKEGRRNIYVIDSIKHPEEVDELRHIYGASFYLFAVHSSQLQREHFLWNECLIHDQARIAALIARDNEERHDDERLEYGQSTSDAFHRADFFLTEDGNSRKVWNTTQRFLDAIFGDPFRTPTFNEYAMFMAYGSSMRSADMSRQVGAVITRDKDILSVGANECPKPFGGTYWPNYNSETGEISDTAKGRDYKRGVDRNAKETQLMIACLVDGLSDGPLQKLKKNIQKSGLSDITEFGRVVHAEMDAILGCARRGITCDDSTIFCTTFPCHNCAKHIVASGIAKVVYIEPYPKSKAFDMHDDAVRSPDDIAEPERVLFVPFVGVGPRQFADLFSLTLSAGARIRRKEKGSINVVAWKRSTAVPRVKCYPVSYLDNENDAATQAVDSIKRIERVKIDAETSPVKGD